MSTLHQCEWPSRHCPSIEIDPESHPSCGGDRKEKEKKKRKEKKRKRKGEKEKTNGRVAKEEGRVKSGELPLGFVSQASDLSKGRPRPIQWLKILQRCSSVKDGPAVS